MADRKLFALDIDGTLADFSEGWKGVEHFGAPLPGRVEWTRRFSEHHDLLIFTTRTNPEIGRGLGVTLLRNIVRDWLDHHGFAYVGIWTGVGKPLVAGFLDDRAIRFDASSDLDDVTRMALALASHVPPGCSLGGKELGRG